MLVVDTMVSGMVKSTGKVNIIDTEDLVCEEAVIGNVYEKLKSNGTPLLNVTKLTRRTYSVTKIQNITITSGGMQVVKKSFKEAYIFYDDNSYIEFKVSDDGVLYLNDREVSSNCMGLGLPYVDKGNMFMSYCIRDYGFVRMSVAFDKCFAYKNGITKRRQILLGQS